MQQLIETIRAEYPQAFIAESGSRRKVVSVGDNVSVVVTPIAITVTKPHVGVIGTLPAITANGPLFALIAEARRR